MENYILLYPKACTLSIENNDLLGRCSNSGCTSCKKRTEMAIRQHQNAAEAFKGRSTHIDEPAFYTS